MNERMIIKTTALSSFGELNKDEKYPEKPNATVSRFGIAVRVKRIATIIASFFPKLLSAVVLIIILSFISYWGIKISRRLNIIFTCIELFGLLLIIFFAAPFIGSVDYFEIPSFKGVFIGAALAFFAYIGFEDTVKLSEETKEP